MGKYSSDSDSSDYSRKKKSRRNRSSSQSSSSSRYSSRSKKSKKSKKCRRSRSSERSSKHRRRSRDRHSPSRTRKSKHSKHSRRRSRSSSRSKHSSNRSPTYSSRSHSKDKRSPSYSRSRRRSRSRSPSSRSNDKKSPLFDGAELLAKLNRAATEAMSENKKNLESLFGDNPESRNNAINEINSPHFVQKAFCSGDRKVDGPVVTDVTNFVNFSNMKEEPGCLLHPNLLIEDQVEKTNRWIKKLYQIRQRSFYGDPLLVD